MSKNKKSYTEILPPVIVGVGYRDLYDDYDGMYGLEIKDVALYKREAMDNWESGIIPDQYYIQILHYMIILNNNLLKNNI